jgi:adenosylcobinamide kinase/adenosylcobinamide-phosphate guanylyltransferase
MGRLVFVLGGARSGKSSFAKKIAEDLGKDVIYLATAVITDDEMAERISLHRKERPSHWQTVEEPYDLKKIGDVLKNSGRIVLLDCLTILLSNIILKREKDIKALYREEEMIVRKFSRLADAALKGNSKCIFVANEVSMGICPDNYLARVFRDIAGRINQEISQKAEEVYFLLAGLGQKIKG